MKALRHLLLLSLIWGAGLARATTADDERAVRQLVSLVDYLGGDYTEAVREGKIVNPAEYKEMQDFAESAARAFDKVAARLKPDTAQEVRGNLTALKVLIDQKADVGAVRALTRAVKDRVIDGLAFNTTPPVHPERETAVKLFAQHCASCHGANGKGDGPAAKGMEPPPRNFHESVMDVSSPFKLYNTLQLGVEGTTMVAYAGTLADGDLWSLAFQAMALRHGLAEAPAPEAAWAKVPEDQRLAMTRAGLSLALLSRSSDDELTAWLKDKAKVPEPGIKPALAALRVAAPYLKSTPRIASAAPTSSDGEPTAVATTPAPTAPALAEHLAYVAARTADARARFAAGDHAGADEQLLDAYLQGFERLEVPLGVSHGDVVRRAENDFIAARQAARSGNATAFTEALASLDQDMADSRAALLPSGDSPMASTGDFFASLIIILREGFEAFLIIGALLALMTKTGATTARKWIHLGWISAVAAGIGTYFLFSLVFEISGAARETIEAVCTGLAAVVLFYVSFWLLNQAERGRWERYLKDSAKESLTSQTRVGAMFFLAFIAVYREAAETALFYQALGNAAASPATVALGFVVGCLLLFAICAAIMRFGVRLPLRRFFLITSSVMILISIVLAGKAMHELIEAGFVHPTSIPVLPTIDALGIYPNWESLGVQLGAIGLALALVWLSQRHRGPSGTAGVGA